MPLEWHKLYTIGVLTRMASSRGLRELSFIRASASLTCLPPERNRWRMKTELFGLSSMARSTTTSNSVVSSRPAATYSKDLTFPYHDFSEYACGLAADTP